MRVDRRVTGQPSSKTSYVVVGEDAGPSKLKAIAKNNLKTLDEDGFLDLIATRVTDPSSLDDKTRKKMQKEEEAIRQAAREMEAREATDIVRRASVDICAPVDEQANDASMTRPCCKMEGTEPVDSRFARVSSRREQQARQVAVAALRCEMERCRAIISGRAGRTSVKE